jgi:hypothetical protein
MSESWSTILKEMLYGSGAIIFSLLRIIIPLMIFIEILLKYNIAEKIANKLNFFANFLGISKNALLPLIIGVLIGITYGAGTLKIINEETPLTKKDLTLISIFLFSCHGIIETTVLLWSVGANIFFICFLRLLIAILITAAAGRILKK